MKQDARQFDVVISGGGIVGLTAACLFARQGMGVCLVDNESRIDWNPDIFYPRVSALNLASIRVFEYIGAWQSITRKRVSPFTCMTVWEHGSDARIEFTAQDMQTPELGVIVENNAIIASLSDKLHANYNVTVLEDVTLKQRTDEDTHLALKTCCGKTILCQLLIGADGAQSATRKLCKIPGTYQDFDQHAIVSTLEITGRHSQTAWQAFLTSGPAAMLPLADGRCSLVWSCDNHIHETLMQLDDKDFCKRVSDIFEAQLGRIVRCETRHAFPLRQHHADTYLACRTALIGDAAHLVHPLAGLGANIGIQDAASLSQIVETARSRGKEFHTRAVLRRYERWRKGENALVLNTTRSLKSLYGSNSRTIRGARRNGLKIIQNLPLIKRQFARYAMGISGDLPGICKSSGGNLLL